MNASDSPSEAGNKFRPTASLELIHLRGRLLGRIRAFFIERGYWEVETPILSRDTVVDANIEPFTVDGRSPSIDGRGSGSEMFLQTSPEFFMKRLLAAGAPSLFQFTHVFRRGEVGPFHNPEFTMLEWYGVGSTYRQQMDLVESLVSACVAEVRDWWRALRPSARPAVKGPSIALPRIERITYEEAFRDALGLDGSVLTLGPADLAQLAADHDIAPPPSLDRGDLDGWFNLLLALCVEPVLARRPAVFVCDYPATQAALARVRPGEIPVAERFELYLGGIEICNGYQELTDSQELRRRITEQNCIRLREGGRPLPSDNRLLDAMDFGLPECSGVALGFDRLVMWAAGAANLADVMPFPFERA